MSSFSDCCCCALEQSILISSDFGPDTVAFQLNQLQSGNVGHFTLLARDCFLLPYSLSFYKLVKLSFLQHPLMAIHYYFTFRAISFLSGQLSSKMIDN